jgi:hypothetical protein
MIMVTPQRLASENDSQWRALETTLKGVASRAAQGDQIHYIGSREYREGVPVRNWDFSSWARLGKPILREFSSPASRSVRIVVDNIRSSEFKVGLKAPANTTPTGDEDWLEAFRLGLLASFSSWRRQPEQLDPSFERILSLAASSVETLVRNGAAVVLQFVHSPSEKDVATMYRCEAGADPSEVLIALGNAKLYDAHCDEVWMVATETHRSDEEPMILSCRHRSELPHSDPLSRLAKEATWITSESIEPPDPLIFDQLPDASERILSSRLPV